MSPRWMCQRSIDLGRASGPRRSAISVMAGSSSTPPWAIGDHASVQDAVSRRVGAHVLVGEVRVHLDLVDRRHDVGLRGQPLEMPGLEVGDADRARAAVGVNSSSVCQVET